MNEVEIEFLSVLAMFIMMIVLIIVQLLKGGSRKR